MDLARQYHLMLLLAFMSGHNMFVLSMGALSKTSEKKDIIPDGYNIAILQPGGVLD